MLNVLQHASPPPDARYLTIGVSDERFTKDPKENNFLLLKETAFCREALLNGAHAINTGASFENVEALATMMERAWESWMEKNPEGQVLATFGMGADGHTAGIMPYAEDPGMFEILFEDTRRLVIGYDARGKNPLPLRATATLPFLRSRVEGGIAYVAGKEKEAALERALSNTGEYAETPARLFGAIPRFTLFTDTPLNATA